MSITEANALFIISETVDFLATKHKTTPQAIVAAMEARNVLICEQFAELTALAVEAVAAR